MYLVGDGIIGIYLIQHTLKACRCWDESAVRVAWGKYRFFYLYFRFLGDHTHDSFWTMPLPGGTFVGRKWDICQMKTVCHRFMGSSDGKKNIQHSRLMVLILITKGPDQLVICSMYGENRRCTKSIVWTQCPFPCWRGCSTLVASDFRSIKKRTGKIVCQIIVIETIHRHYCFESIGDRITGMYFERARYIGTAIDRIDGFCKTLFLDGVAYRWTVRNTCTDTGDIRLYSYTVVYFITHCKRILIVNDCIVLVNDTFKFYRNGLSMREYATISIIY